MQTVLGSFLAFFSCRYSHVLSSDLSYWVLVKAEKQCLFKLAARVKGSVDGVYRHLTLHDNFY